MKQLNALTTISKDKATPINELNAAQLSELQTALVKLGYPAGIIDVNTVTIPGMPGRSLWMMLT